MPPKHKKRGGGGSKGRNINRRKEDDAKGQLKNKRKGKNNWKPITGRPSLAQLNSTGSFPELMDLDSNVYTPDSMRSAGQNAGRRKYGFTDEIDYTGRHRRETLKRQLRKLPIEFIKAKEVYDPSAVLYKKIANVTITSPKILSRESDLVFSQPNTEEEEFQIYDDYNRSDDFDEDDVDVNLQELLKQEEAHSRAAIVAEFQVEEKGETHAQILNLLTGSTGQAQPDAIEEKQEEEEEEENDDDDGESTYSDGNSAHEEDASNVDEVLVFDDNRDRNYPSSTLRDITPYKHLLEQQSDDDYDNESPMIRVGKFEGKATRNASGDLEITLPKLNFRKPKNFGFVDENDESDFELEVYDEIEHDDAVDEEEQVESEDDANEENLNSIRAYITGVMKNTFAHNDSSDDTDHYEGDEEDEDYENEDIEFEYDDSDIDADGKTTHQANSNLGDSEMACIDDEEKDIGPEFGYLPEDYEAFDVSQVQVTNIRLSAGDAQYLVKSPLLFGSDDFRWWDKEDFVDELVDNGLAHHRVNAFLKFVTSGLTNKPDQPLSPGPEYSDLDMIEDSSESSEDDDDDDGMNNLIQFSRNNPRIIDDPIEINTRSMKTKGRGRKKTLDPAQLEELEMREELLNQFMFRKSSKKDKHDSKQLEIKANKLMGENFMVTKYPFEMHIRDIRLEYDEFYEDPVRNTVRFPPLDPHGIKTLKKLADLYHLKARKFGKGPKSYVVIIKNKRTYLYPPEKSQINRILKQRPLFKRSDVRTSKEEALQLKNKRKTSAKELANKGSKHNYKEGDLVAAQAPEIGSENIGRKLLEKMGWARGEALGAHGNKGIVEPIQAKMKLTKIGIK